MSRQSRIEAALRAVFAADSVLIDYAASILEDAVPQSAEAMFELLAEKIVECVLVIFKYFKRDNKAASLTSCLNFGDT